MIDGSTWLIGTGGVLGLLVILWGVSLRLKDAGIVDLFWGTGFVVLAWAAYGFGNAGPRGPMVVALVTLWGLRLTFHLARRNLGHAEDRRYRKMREDRGPSFWWKSFFIVFLFQGALMSFIALPIFAAIESFAPLNWIDAVAVALFGVGFFFEAVGDLQLSRFIANPANQGRVMDEGLWRYTRHPNYFGDATLWWGFGLFGAASGAEWTLVCPAVMSLLLLRVSGVRLLEKDISERRPKYAEYIRRTNAFFPGPRRSSSE